MSDNVQSIHKRAIMAVSFFPKARVLRETDSDSTAAFVDCNGHLFISIATWLLDEIQRSTLSSSYLEDILVVLSMQQARYFPDKPWGLQYGSLMQWLKTITKPSQKVEIVLMLAYVLAQMTFTELCTHIECYPQFFIQQTSLSPEQCLQQWLAQPDIHGVEAFVKITQLPVTIERITDDKQLPARIQYCYHRDDGLSKSTLILQLQGTHTFKPFLLKKEWHALLSTASMLAPTLAFNREMVLAMSTASATLTRVVDDFWQAYEESYHRLWAMATAHELTQEQLIELYLAIPPDYDHLPSGVWSLGSDYGTQAYFRAMASWQHRADHAVPSFEQPALYQEQITQQLICTLSRALNCHRLTWDQIEKRQQSLSAIQS